MKLTTLYTYICYSCNMAAKKKPTRSQPTPPNPNSRVLKDIKRKPASAADFRMKEEGDKRKAARTDPMGRSGFGASVSKPIWEKTDPEYKAARKVLESRGVNPDAYTSGKGPNKGKKPLYDYLQANSPEFHFWSGKSKGMSGLFESGPDKAAYKRIAAEIKLKQSNPRGMNSSGQIVPGEKKKKK